MPYIWVTTKTYVVDPFTRQTAGSGCITQLDKSTRRDLPGELCIKIIAEMPILFSALADVHASLLILEINFWAPVKIISPN